MSTTRPPSEDALIFERISPIGAWICAIVVLAAGFFFPVFVWLMGNAVPSGVWMITLVCAAFAALSAGVRSSVVYLSRAGEVRSRTLFFGILLRDRVLGSSPFAVRTQVERKDSPNDPHSKWQFYLWINDNRTYLTSYKSGTDASCAARLVRMRLRALSRDGSGAVVTFRA